MTRTINVRLASTAIFQGFELSVAGQNLFDKRHSEFGAAPGRSEFERSACMRARWTR
jgi:iron complex outermembrane recepter protein